MGFKSVFRKVAGLPAQSFNDMDRMETRPLPIPGRRPDEGIYLQFSAKRDNHGRWAIEIHSNDLWFVKLMPGYDLSMAAVKAALEKHGAGETVKDKKVSFDTAYLVLRELEEAHLKYSNVRPSLAEPSSHYTRAHSLLPQLFREGLDDLYQARLPKGDIMPKPAPRPPRGPQPG